MDTGPASLIKYDNFLSTDDFNQIKNILLGNNFPWYINKVVSFSNDVQFTHVFYDNDKVNSNAFEILTSILDKINYKKLIRVKANLYSKTETILHHKYHIDYPNCTTGIFYVNSNNGITIFEDAILSSVENRFVQFDSNLIHKGTTCTDENFRCVINFNYEE